MSGMKRDPNCTLCPLHETAEYVCLLGQGPEPCDIMVIGEAPGHREDTTGKPFVGRAGQLLDQMFETVGLSRKKMFITNAVACRPPENRTPKKKEIQACRKWLNYQIAMVKPKYVLLLGGVALQSLLGLKGIKSLRGRPIEHKGMIVLPTFHPSYVLRGEGRERVIVEQDLTVFRDIIEYGGIPREERLRSVIVDTWDKVDEMINALHGPVSGDLETTCLYPWAPIAKIVTLGFGTSSGEYSLFINHKDSPWSKADIKKIIKRITEKLDDCILVFQNGKFDCLWMFVHFDVLWHNDFDTMLAHYLVNENSPHDLEFLAQLYFGAPKWDISLDQKQGNASMPVIAGYHAHDLFYTLKLYYKLKKELAKDPQVEKVFRKILMPAANLFVEMEAHGCFIDEKKHLAAEKFLKSEIAITTKNLNKWGIINWGSTKQVGELLYGKLKIKCPLKTKKGANSTSESALKQIDHPAVADLLRFRGAKQQLSFFIEGWRPFIVNNRIHPSFKLHGTVTGRPSCEHPNFQQVPRDTRIRSQITAPPGFVLLEADLSQIELRIIAEVSRDPELVHCFQTGVDVHWRTLIHSLGDSDGTYTEEVIETIKVLCLRYGLPEDRSSSKLLLKLFKEGESPEKSDKLLQLASKIGVNKTSRDREWGPRPDFPRLERWTSMVAEKEVPKALLRVLREYALSVSASQERKQQGLETLKLSDALQTLSSIGPSIAEGINDCWKEARKKAKAINFGFSFGMWHKKFVIYARDNYGIKLTEEEARRRREGFFQLYQLGDWHDSQQRFARRHGFVRSLFGRMRRLPQAQGPDDTPERGEALRQAINSPIQSCASDLNLSVLLQMSHEFPREIFRPIITVHDSILAEVPIRSVEKVINRIEEVMRGPDILKEFGVKFTVPLCGDTKLGPWGSGVSYKKWKSLQ